MIRPTAVFNSAIERISIAGEFAWARIWKKEHPEAVARVQTNSPPTVGEMMLVVVEKEILKGDGPARRTVRNRTDTQDHSL